MKPGSIARDNEAHAPAAERSRGRTSEITIPNGRSRMSHKHTNLLRAIFQDPVSANVHWREVESLLRHLGVNVEPAHGARFRMLYNGIEGFVHMPHHGSSCTKQDIRQLREYLAHAGLTPSTVEAGED
jgi:hypothetical protein